MISKLNTGQPPKVGWEVTIMEEITEVEDWLNAMIQDEEIT